jgi:HEAT repeat protein
MTLVEATAAINSGNRNDVEAGIQSLGLLGDTAALDLLIARVRRGLPRDLLSTAMFTLGAMGDPTAGPLLIELTTHRSAEIRVHAVETLAALQPPDGASALMAALSDADSQVRAAAAVGLGDMGASEALDRLFQAQDRGVSEASIAIGKVVKTGDVPRLLEYLGRMPLGALVPALKAVIARKDVDEAARLQVVARLAELATPEVKALLKEILDDNGSALPARVRTALATAVQQIAD